ncbi:MAG: N-acetylmuramoyl-L-alanine amidase [Campylobacterales bacterium]|nr:N-acetylmuramoyl-L-alanine amidase [Campylobacterales bacterium]
MNPITHIIVHCSDSSFGSATDIRDWHVRGNGWRDIGYHFVILNGDLGQGLRLESMDGSIEAGRQIDGDTVLRGDEVGAHAAGMNANSIGVCLIGAGAYTHAQLGVMFSLLEELRRRYSIPIGNIIGHREIPGVKKTCPTGLDMHWVRSTLVGMGKGG